MKVRTTETAIGNRLIGKLRDYALLVKLRLSSTVVFSSIMAYAITALEIKLSALVILGLGGFLVTAAANALNQVLEKDYDRLMKRTADRPIAAGRMTMSEGIIAAGFMSIIGITFLAMFNPWTAFLGMLALVTYAFLYTPLKRISSVAVTVGALAGAFPVMIGGVAAQGSLSGLAFLLFSIQFLWQYPHFWSIGWLGFKDYHKAGYQFVPMEKGNPHPIIAQQAFGFSALLIIVVSLPYFFGYTSLLLMTVAMAVSIGFAYTAYAFYKEQTRKTALRLMFYSLIYIPGILIAFFVDRLLF